MKNKIKILRAEKGITQEELAEAVNVTRQTIIAIEKNKYVPSLELAFRIARYFDKGDMAAFACHLCEDALTKEEIQVLKKKLDELN